MIYLSFMGLVLGLLLFIVLCFRKANTLLSAVLSACVMIVFSLPQFTQAGASFYDVLIAGKAVSGVTSYMEGVSGFIKSYLLLFVLSSLCAKVMDDGGAIRRLAIALTRAIKKSGKNNKFFAACVLPMVYIVLGYCGISGFVMMFTVVALGRELFSECDLPWRFYCYGALGNMTNGILAGNLQAQNIKAAALFGVSTTAGVGMSLVFTIVQLATAGLMIYFDVRKSERRGEGFLPDGEGIMKVQLKVPIPEDKLPTLFLSLLPLVTTILVIIVCKAKAETTLLISTLLSLVLYRKRFDKLGETISSGIQLGVGSAVTVAAVAGLATIIPEISGFSLITSLLDKLPDLYGGVALMLVITALVANPVPAFSSEGVTSILTQKFAGLTAENAARLSLCSQVLPCPPWNAGAINAIALTKLDFKTAAWYYFKASFFPGIAALAVTLLLIECGVFI